MAPTGGEVGGLRGAYSALVKRFDDRIARWAAVALFVAACGGLDERRAIRRDGNQRWLDVGGGIELALDPSTDERHIQSTERDGHRLIAFHEAATGGGWARVEVRQRQVDAAATARIVDDPMQLLPLLQVPAVSFQPASGPGRAWVSEVGLIEGTHHEPRRDGKGHTTEWDPPRYLWSGAFLAGGMAVAVTYTAAIDGGGDTPLTAEEILARGRVRHGATANGLFSRVRLPRREPDPR